MTSPHRAARHFGVASALFAALVAAGGSAAAQAPAPAPKGPPPLKLQLEKVEHVKPGSIAIAEGVATAQPSRIWMDSLGINQPVSVVVASANPAERLTIALTKTGWDESLHAATTGGDGTATVQVRTQGEMGMKVTSAGGAPVPFLLAVWVGDEVTPDMPDVLVPVKNYSQAGSWWMTWLKWGGMGLGVVLLLGVVFWLGRRAGTKTTAALVALALGASALALHAGPGPQPPPRSGQTLPGIGTPPIGNQPTQPVPGIGTDPTLPGQDLGTARTMPGTPAGGEQAARQVPARDFYNYWGNGPGNAGNAQANPQVTPQDVQSMRDIEANRQADAARGNRVQEFRAITPDDIRNRQIEEQAAANRRTAEERGMNVQQLRPGVDIPTQAQAQQMARDAVRFNPLAGYGAAADARTSAAIRSAVERSSSQFQAGMLRGLTVAAALIKGWQILHSSDGGCVPDASPSGMPTVPSMCAGSGDCRACYAQSYDRLNRIRFTFEKLRCVYQNTKDIGMKGISFGDTVSPIHGVSGLAWQFERRKIEDALKTLNQSYDSKYAELLGKLGEDMQAINACEAQYFGNPDWYARYGFMFHTFMAERYKR